MKPNNLQRTEKAAVAAMLSIAATGQGPSKTKAERFDASRSASLAECLALDYLKPGGTESKEPDALSRALKVLWDGIVLDTRFKTKITGGRPSYRLYDLYAGLAIRSGNQSELAKLIQYVEDLWAQELWVAERALRRRVQTWRAPTEHWTTKWSSTELKWKASRGNPKKHPELYSGYCS